MTASPAPERMARQGLLTRPARTPAEAAALVCGLQAQDLPAGRLGVRARSAGVTDAEVQRALDDERRLVRTTLMRGTVHLVAREDVRWLTALLGPAVARSFGSRWRGLGLTPDILDRTAELLPEVLADGPRTRPEVAAALVDAGVELRPQPDVATHVLLHATTRGLVCRAPDRGREPTFTLLSTWVPATAPGPTGEDALAELARRYFRAFSPATAADFTTWSGLPSGRAIELIAEELTPCTVAGRPAYRYGEVAPARGLCLLPGFDNYVLGYRDRDDLIAAEHREHIYDGGVIRPTVVLDGRVVGRWRLARTRSSARLIVEPFVPLRPRARAQLAHEAEDVARFLDRPVELQVDDSA